MGPERSPTRMAGAVLLGFAALLFGSGLVVYATGFEVAFIGMIAAFAIGTLAVGFLAVPPTRR
ncbi:hypothetical protein [Agreia sp. COWG]|uniref:hypothetical protein n=1 Tax=Agreia sp. COWG TaxID=2773266 RepID=UPI0019295AD4|nr:hypothetical protein [Agreia sp. COWG]CAD5991041.1 conserved protein of unknown function [Agreia sp. COWG]